MTVRVIGFDDAPFTRADAEVCVSGVVCAGTRFEGMLWGRVTRDGEDATSALAALLGQSKFAAQVQLVLTDGVTLGGLNVLDLPALHASVGVPVVAVMRRMPDLSAFRRAVDRVDPARWDRVARAGPIHSRDGFVFQVVGAEPETIGPMLAGLTDRGAVPEALRLAHLIGSAVQTGQSGRRA